MSIFPSQTANTIKKARGSKRMHSVWSETISAPIFPRAEKNIQTDVAIIGGGMAGILCGLALKERGIDHVILESETIGSGVTKRTTAVLSVQNELLFGDLVKKHGKAHTKLYLEASLNAIKRFRAYAETIPCDFETLDAITYSLHDRDKMKNDALLLQSMGYPAEFVAQTALPFRVAGAVRFPNMAQFHPLKFLYHVAKDLPIYEHTKALRTDGTTVVTPNARIRANKVIVTTHFPFIDRYGLYLLKMHQIRSHVIAYENAPQLGCTIMDEAEHGIYLRNYGKYLLIGGGDRKTGKDGNGFEVIRDFAKKYFPEAKEVTAWSNRDCISLDSLPYIGRYSVFNPNLFVATGFCGWGMTSSMIASELLADLACNKPNRFASVFAPNRKMPFLPLAQNVLSSAIGLLTPTVPRCSHLGCALHWNENEGIWECPCHGSVFAKNGEVLNNPANKNIHAK